MNKNSKSFPHCFRWIISTATAASMLLSSAFASYTATVKADSLNVRKAPGGSVINHLPNGTKVTVLDDSDATWDKIVVNGKEGYVSKEYLVKPADASAAPTTTATPTATPSTDATQTEIPKTENTDAANTQNTPITENTNNATTTPAANTAKIKCDSSVNLRAEPNTTSKVLTSLKNGTAVIIAGQSNDWYKVQVNGKVGFVRGDLLEKTEAAPETDSTGQASSDSAASDTAVPAQPTDTTTSPETDDKANTNADTATPSDTTTPEGSTENTVTQGRVSCSSTVNLRQQATTASASLSSLVNGTTITITGKTGDWYQVLVNGKNGFIREDLVDLVDPTVAAIESTTKNSIIKPTAKSVAFKGSSSDRDTVLAYAAQFLGTPYRFGGNTPDGFDCSGFVSYVYSHTVGDLPRIAQSQYDATTHISREDLLPGDLVFFGSSVYSIGHVGIYVGNDEFIHSPSSGDVVKYSSLSGSYGGRFQGGGRVIFDNVSEEELQSLKAGTEKSTKTDSEKDADAQDTSVKTTTTTTTAPAAE